MFRNFLKIVNKLTKNEKRTTFKLFTSKAIPFHFVVVSNTKNSTFSVLCTYRENTTLGRSKRITHLGDMQQKSMKQKTISSC